MNRKIRINGALHAYLEAGREDAHPIIVIHGGRGASTFHSCFDAFEPLSDQYRVIAFERRGLGQSEFLEPMTVDQLVDDVETLRHELVGTSPATILGQSFGGQVAMMHALKYGESVSRLILLGATASHEFERTALEEFDKRAHRVPMATRDMVARYMRGDLISEMEGRLIQFALGRLYDENYSAEKALERALNADFNLEAHKRFYMGTAYDIRPQLPTLGMPALVMCGEDDWITPVSFSTEIHRLIAGSELHVIANEGHSIHTSANGKTLSIIRDYLARTA